MRKQSFLFQNDANQSEQKDPSSFISEENSTRFMIYDLEERLWTNGDLREI